jgi:uncharacterized protein (TIGR02652 family)
MMNLNLQYPIFGPEILCPHCHQNIPALTLTDSYLCHRHGAFEANPETGELVHLQSGRHWKLWDEQWYRQHTHPDGIRFEIHEALDHLYRSGYQATKVIIASRYRDLVNNYLEHSSSDTKSFKLYGLSVEFSPDPVEEPRWQVINFDFKTKPGVPKRYPYSRLFE